MIPNTIPLICKGRYDEMIVAAIVKPGQVTQRDSNGKVSPHAVVGGNGPLFVVIEDALRGADKTVSIPVGDPARGYWPAKGDKFLMRLAAGQNVANAARLMSAGDGSLMAYPATGGDTLYQITAASSVITNVTAETTFSNGSYTIPANTLKAGDTIRIRGRVTVTGQNSTNTHNIKVYIGSTVVLDAGAVSLAASDVVTFDVTITVRTAGASGTIVASGTFAAGTPGTVTDKTFVLASTAIDTTATQAVTVKSTASAQSTGNIVRLDELAISENDAAVSGFTALFEAAEAIDNSAGIVDAWIRAFVI